MGILAPRIKCDKNPHRSTSEESTYTSVASLFSSGIESGIWRSIALRRHSGAIRSPEFRCGTMRNRSHRRRDVGCRNATPKRPTTKARLMPHFPRNLSAFSAGRLVVLGIHRIAIVKFPTRRCGVDAPTHILRRCIFAHRELRQLRPRFSATRNYKGDDHRHTAYRI